MQKLLLCCLAFCLTAGLSAQDPIYVQEFNGDAPAFSSPNASFTVSQGDGQIVVTGNPDAPSGAFDGFYLDLGGTFDLSEAPQIYIRMKDNEFGHLLRVDLVGTNDAFSNVETGPVTKDIDTEFSTIEFDYAGLDLGDVDITQVKALFLYLDPGLGGYASTFFMDFISIGAELAGPIMSDIYQDHMDSDSSFARFVFFSDPFSGCRSADENGDSTVVTLKSGGDFGGNQFPVLVYEMASPPDYIPAPIDISEDRILYVRARSLDAQSPVLRVDVQDEDNVSSNRTPVARTIGSEWRVYEFDYTGAEGLPLGETPACPETAEECIVNLSMISELIIYLNPGTPGFIGEVEIDWISFGTNLEGEGPTAPLLYSDNFGNDRVDFTGSDDFAVEEADDILSVTGTGVDGDYSSFGYQLHTPTDSPDTLIGPTTADLVAGQNRVFLRARTLGQDVRLRIDVIDTMGRNTDNGLAKIITNEWQVITYDFDGRYLFNDYGGGDDAEDDRCNPASPCPVDASVISSMLLFPNPDPADGAFNGTIEFDWISIGRPLTDADETATGVPFYSDNLEDAADRFSGSPSGIAYSVVDGVLVLEGDGVDMMDYQQIRYGLTDENGSPIKGDLVGSGDELLISARILNNDVGEPLRIDIYDESGFESNQRSVTNLILGDEFTTYTYDFAGLYAGGDGGYTPGSPCPGMGTFCDVDGERVTELLIFPSPNPEDGPLVGTIEIDWISFGVDLSTSVRDFADLNTLKVFPNPAIDQLGVQYDLVSGSTVSVSLFDALGRRQLVENLGSRAAGVNFERLDVSHLPVGTYHMQILVNGRPTRAVTVLKR